MGSTSLYMLKKAITLIDDLHHRNTHNPYKTINILGEFSQDSYTFLSR